VSKRGSTASGWLRTALAVAPAVSIQSAAAMPQRYHAALASRARVWMKVAQRLEGADQACNRTAATKYAAPLVQATRCPDTELNMPTPSTAAMPTIPRCCDRHRANTAGSLRFGLPLPRSVYAVTAVLAVVLAAASLLWQVLVERRRRRDQRAVADATAALNAAELGIEATKADLLRAQGALAQATYETPAFFVTGTLREGKPHLHILCAGHTDWDEVTVFRAQATSATLGFKGFASGGAVDLSVSLGRMRVGDEKYLPILLSNVDTDQLAVRFECVKGGDVRRSVETFKPWQGGVV
jgi:hypothetical protein